MMANRNYDINEIFGWGVIGILALLLLIGVVVVVGGWTMGFIANSEAVTPLEELPIVENPIQEMVQPQPVAEPEHAQDPPPVVARVREPRLRPEPEPRLQPEPHPAPTNRSIPVVPRSLPDNDNAVSVRNREPVQRRTQTIVESPSVPDGARFANIFQAAGLGSVEDVRYFLDRGIDVNATEEVIQNTDGSGTFRGGGTPLHNAVMSNSLDVVKFLISRGADVNRKGGAAGWTPLHRAVIARNEQSAEIVPYLISQGADVTATTRGGETPLHLAAGQSNPITGPYICQFLITNKANVNARGQAGRTPMDVAQAANRETERVILRQAGGKYGWELDNEPSTPAQRR